MPATLIKKARFDLDHARFVSVSIYELPAPLQGSAHRFKYRLALVINGVCVLRYDNEAGKGDHKHVNGKQQAYTFIDLKQLNRDFWEDVIRV